MSRDFSRCALINIDTALQELAQHEISAEVVDAYVCAMRSGTSTFWRKGCLLLSQSVTWLAALRGAVKQLKSVLIIESIGTYLLLRWATFCRDGVMSELLVTKSKNCCVTNFMPNARCRSITRCTTRKLPDTPFGAERHDTHLSLKANMSGRSGLIKDQARRECQGEHTLRRLHTYVGYWRSIADVTRAPVSKHLNRQR